MEKQTIVFAGFDSKDLESIIELHGGTVKQLPKDTYILVYEPSAKTQVMTKDQLIAHIASMAPVHPPKKMEKEVVVFSGFEDKELENLIVEQGGVVKSSLVKTTTLLAYDAKKAGKKVEEAKARGIKIMTKEDLVAMLTGQPPVPVPVPRVPSPRPAVVPPPAPRVPSPRKAVVAPGSATSIKGEVVVFSGFRSDELKDKIEAKGGKVEKTLVKATTVLVYDAKKAGNKVKEAQERGLKVYTREEMEALLSGTPPAPVPTEPTKAEKPPSRPPKLWDYDEDKYEYPEDYFKKIKGHVLPGDFLAPIDGYRGNGVAIVGPGKTLHAGIQLGNGDVMLPPWVLQLGLNNGFSMKDLLSIYQGDSIFVAVLYPKSLQKEHLKYSKKGQIVSIFGNEDGTDFVMDSKHYYLDDINIMGGIYSDIFDIPS